MGTHVPAQSIKRESDAHVCRDPACALQLLCYFWHEETHPRSRGVVWCAVQFQVSCGFWAPSTCMLDIHIHTNGVLERDLDVCLLHKLTTCTLHVALNQKSKISDSTTVVLIAKTTVYAPYFWSRKENKQTNKQKKKGRKGTTKKERNKERKTEERTKLILHNWSSRLWERLVEFWQYSFYMYRPVH